MSLRMKAFTKPEVHNTEWSREKSRAVNVHNESIVKFDRVVFELCDRTDIQTMNKQLDRLITVHYFARPSQGKLLIPLNEQEAFEKCWAHSPLRAVLHCHSPGVATVARRLRFDVHDNDNNDNNNDNDNA